MNYYTVTALDENTYRIGSKEFVFCELLVGTRKALLIDTGYGFGNLKEVVESITNLPLIIVNTHGHVDHTSGNCKFDIPVYISKKDMELCKRHNQKIMRMKSIENAKHTMNYETGKVEYGLPEDFDEEKYLNGGCGELIELKDGQFFALGGITVEAIATPGHTKGGMSFYYREKQRLYAGDEINGFCWLFDDDATDMDTHINTLNRVIEINPQEIYGAHMPSVMTVEDVKRFLDTALNSDFEKGIPFQNIILDTNHEVRICLGEGVSMEDMGKPGFSAVVVDEKRAKKKRGKHNG